MRVPGYNSPQRMTFTTRLLAWIVVLFCLPAAHGLNSWDSPAADFARQITALTGPGTITLSVTDRSNLSPDDVTTIRHALERELRASGVTVRASDADSEVRVTLTQNIQGLLWVAEVQEGSEIKVAMLPVAGSTTIPGNSAGPSIVLRATLIFGQSDQILDLALLATGADPHLVILEPESIKVYSQTSGSWQLSNSYAIAHSQPFPREMRGRLISGGEHLFDAYLPGVVCSATRNGDSWNLNVTCGDSDDPWPVASQKAFYNATRNFFTGVLTPGFGPKLPPFYSAAAISRADGGAFLFNDLTGAVHILEGNSHKMLIGARDWGSDFAAVRSGCDQGTQVLTSAAGWPVSDSLRGYEITGREATPVSAPLTFDGVITAVWPAGDMNSAIVVVQKQQESRYEAYSVSLVCSH